MRKRLIIMGAAGRDFHNFNLRFRDNEAYEVVAFTATQIPDIDGRRYPPELAGKLYPKGIPIADEQKLRELINIHCVEQVIFSYSDIPYSYVGHRLAIANASGADFVLLDALSTMIPSKCPIVSVCAVRTGVGKSQTTRRVCEILKEMGHKVVVIRHPMPYGDLAKQAVQRFAKYSDLDSHHCTIEEREEYEPHIDRGVVVYAGVDYQAILQQAEQEADIIVWDGGNNDTPFYKPDLHIVLVDPHRAGDELSYYPGGTNMYLADAFVINKIDSASLEGINEVRSNIAMLNSTAKVIEAASPLFLSDEGILSGKRVLVIEDGPTLTHGEMRYGAGVVAARKFGAAKLVDPRPYAVGSIAETFKKYHHLEDLLPAMGYGHLQMKELEATVAAVPCDVVLVATPIDLTRIITVDKPMVRVRYELQEIGTPTLVDVLACFSK